MFGLTRRLDSVETKLDQGFQRVEQKLDHLEKRVGEKLDDFRTSLATRLDGLSGKLDAPDQDSTSGLESLRKTLESGFARCSRQSALNERIAKLERDIERLKANAQP